jgi:UDP-2,3-diacylglucosamine pyrophosphatase LpxH
VFEAAEHLTFDDSSRFVFFSDLHRGNNSRADAFAGNEDLFLQALSHYYRDGFSYIEVGDGDELWINHRLSDILRAHRRTFDLLHRFNRQDRLHIVVGNHDIHDGRCHQVEKDGIHTREGLVLCHSRTGQRLFVFHGHQADFKCDNLLLFSRLLVRHFWRRLKLLGIVGPFDSQDSVPPMGIVERRTIEGSMVYYRKKVEQRIVEWLAPRRQVVICGHTHRPMCAGYGASYFNAGGCVYDGYITGLEIQDGEIRLIRWSSWPRSGQSGEVRVRRELLATPRRLHLLN